MRNLINEVSETVGPQDVHMFDQQPSQLAMVTQETHVMLSEEEEEEDEESELEASRNGPSAQ